MSEQQDTEQPRTSGLQRTNLRPTAFEHTLSLRAIAVTTAIMLTVFLIYLVVTGEESVSVAIACLLLVMFLVIVVYLCLSPDTLRSQYTEQTLSVASAMLQDMRDGLTRESADAICRRLMPETRAVTIAVTDRERIIACTGSYVEDFPPGSPIHTVATHYAIDHGIVQSFTTPDGIRGDRGLIPGISAGIIAPLRVGGSSVGALKFYYRSERDINRTQYALVTGFADLLSAQLATHELELQSELTARAEVRALQAQINPHFLFNTLNTIASLTRTEPLRARELLREFASFYRATLDNSGSLIPVSRELEQTERYLTFEKARFGEERIVASTEVEDAVKNVLVPAFVIQPLVENSVRHAMPDEGPLHIGISVRRDGEESVGITVSDDGVGMDEKTAARLFGERLRTPDSNAPQGGGAGVAMHNISERIKRFYGPRSSSRVVSSPGAGTTVTLHLDLAGSIYDEG